MSALNGDRVQVSVGGQSGRSVGVRFLVEHSDDELEGVEEVIEGRPFAQLIGGGLALLAGGAGILCLILPILGDDLAWLLAGAFLLAWAVVVFRKALRVRPDRVLVYGDRIAFYRWGQRSEYRWSEISHVELLTHVSGDSSYSELLLHLREPGRERGEIRIATTQSYGDLRRVVEAIEKHREVRY